MERWSSGAFTSLAARSRVTNSRWRLFGPPTPTTQTEHSSASMDLPFRVTATQTSLSFLSPAGRSSRTTTQTRRSSSPPASNLEPRQTAFIADAWPISRHCRDGRSSSPASGWKRQCEEYFRMCPVTSHMSRARGSPRLGASDPNGRFSWRCPAAIPHCPDLPGAHRPDGRTRQRASVSPCGLRPRKPSASSSLN